MYTEGFCTRSIGTFEAMTLIFSLCVLPGMVVGYCLSIQLILMTLGANYSQQALLSITGYAFCLKLVFAPPIDTYYLAQIGKNKTYVVSLGIISGVLLLCYSPFAETAVEEKKVNSITVFWLLVTILVSFQCCATESWTVSICDKRYRKYMSILLHTGFCFGNWVSFNAFICLNDIKWINETFYGGKAQLSSPWVTHGQICLFMAASSLALALYVLMMVKEKIITDNEDKLVVPEENERQDALIDSNARDLVDRPSYQVNGLRGVFFEFIPKMFKNRGMRLLAFQIVVTRFFLELYKRSLDLRLVENGLPTGKLATLNAIKFPFIFLGGALSSRFIKTGNLMKKFQLAVVAHVLVCLHRFYITIQLRKPGSHPDRQFWPLLINYIFAIAEDWTFYFWFAHLNQVITDVVYSSTIIGIFLSVYNIGGWGVNPLGFKIIAMFEYYIEDGGYEYAVGLLTALALVSLSLTWKNCQILDDMQVEEYRIMEREGNNKDIELINYLDSSVVEE